MPRLEVRKRLQEISLLICLLISTLLFFTARDEVYKSSWFAYESLRFIMETTKPRQTLNTVRKNSSEISVFVKMLSKFQENEAVQICATFMRSHFATLRFLLSQNKLLIHPLFLMPSKVAYVQFNRRQRNHIFVTHGSPTIFCTIERAWWSINCCRIKVSS
jgi:hypothetical protein